MNTPDIPADLLEAILYFDILGNPGDPDPEWYLANLVETCERHGLDPRKIARRPARTDMYEEARRQLAESLLRRLMRKVS